MGKIQLSGADNARDLGGLKTKDGGMIKDKLLIRSNRLSALTKKDINILKDEYHLRKVVDLRTPMEVEQEMDLLIPGAEIFNIPLFEEEMIGISHEKGNAKTMLHHMDDVPRMEDIYAMLVKNDFCIRQMHRTMECILNENNGAVLWHCTEGKDRCGLISALVLFLLDVPEDIVMEDYLKTNEAAQKRVKSIHRKLKLMRMKEEKIQKIESFFVAKEEYLQASIDGMKELYGTVDDFMKNGIGIGNREKARFKEKVLN